MIEARTECIFPRIELVYFLAKYVFKLQGMRLLHRH